MVRFQQATGCRPAEVCAIRPCDVDTSGQAWIYTPQRHKTQYRGHKRIIFIGPRGQDVLRPYLLRPAEAFCFSPAENERKRRAELHDRRVTPLSCGNRPGTNRKRKPKKRPGECYTSRSYHAAVRHAISRRTKSGKRRSSRIGFPHGIRTSCATPRRRRYASTSAWRPCKRSSATRTWWSVEVYAEKNLALAAEVMFFHNSFLTFSASSCEA